LLDVPIPPPRDDLVALDEALELFAEEHPAKAELVKLRYFAGLSVEDAAGCLDISRATADRWWSFARAWLFEKMQQSIG
jgi:DNA-directed RNA polymerase specialized sigma24 family protein